MVLPPVFYMALDALFRCRRVVKHVFVLRSMGPMAACARDHDIIIPRVEGLCSNGMRRVLRKVMAGHAQVDHGCLLEQ